MSYRIPAKATVEAAVLKVLRKAGGVGSLARLTELVGQELGRRDADARLGPERLRRLVARSDRIRTTIHTRRGEVASSLKRCPVCGGMMKSARNRTLSGGAVELEARCTACPYWTGRERRVPVRYVFHAREWTF